MQNFNDFGRKNMQELFLRYGQNSNKIKVTLETPNTGQFFNQNYWWVNKFQ